MKIENLTIHKQKIDINLEFYFFLKLINKLNPSSNQINTIFQNIFLLGFNIYKLQLSLENIFLKSKTKHNLIKEIIDKLNIDNIDLFDFSLRLYQVKDLLLAEAKISEAIEIDKILNLNPLSLEYDQLSILKPYKTRVKAALLTLLFFEKLKQHEFNFMSQESIEYIKTLSFKIEKFAKLGLESNQIFMLMFNESIDQSIKSDSGSNYEDRILSVLNKIGIVNISKTHDKNDKSTEYDFFFEIDGKTFGISAKRTLRERYKQFIKTSITSKIDISIEITLGVDLNNEKANTIASHGSFIFVSDEIYQSREFLKNNEKVFSVRDLNIETLKKLIKI
jgi:hypothetical protein